jgi:hypothetical protein
MQSFCCEYYSPAEYYQLGCINTAPKYAQLVLFTVDRRRAFQACFSDTERTTSAAEAGIQFTREDSFFWNSLVVDSAVADVLRASVKREDEQLMTSDDVDGGGCEAIPD